MTKTDIEIIKKLNISKDNILWEEPMSKYTTFKIGGPAECLIKINNTEDLKDILQLATTRSIPITVLGNGSNVLVSDNGIKGIVLIIKIEKFEIQEQANSIVNVIVGAGNRLGKISQMLLKQSITGIEELSGIPGTIGGAVTMNAGAHGKEMKDIIKTVTCMDYKGNIKKFINSELEFKYRESIFKKKEAQKYIILQVVLQLQKGKKEEIKEKMSKYATYRREHQPIEDPNAGSTFKRGDGYITAKLIDEAGLKGYTIGGAMVSEKHSGFIINKGNATSKDIEELIRYIKAKIKEKFDKDIKLEIEIIGKE